MLLWGDREIARKPAQARSKWFDADFETRHAAAAAVDLAKRLNWSCLGRQLTLPASRRFVVAGNVRFDGDELATLGPAVIRGLPTDAAIEDSLDVERFRRLLAVAPGQVPEPPPAIMTGTTETGTSTPQPGMAIQRDALGIPGLVYVPNFVSEEEESRLVEEIDQAPWSDELSRRVQHYGWKYDYKARQVDGSMHIGRLPEWAERLGRLFVEKGLLHAMPDQVIVNEYCGKQGIARHADSPSFADGIATISLHDAWEMNFHRKGKRKEKQSLRLDRGSALIMHREARYHWQHEIPKRTREPNPRGGKRKTIDRGRRLSLTFRKVRRQPELRD